MTALTLGVDIGGTKTHIRACAGAQSAGDLVVSSAEWRRRDWQQDAEALLQLVKRLAAGRSIAALAIGAHGCDDESECLAFQSAIDAYADFPVLVVNDSELLPAAAGRPGAIGLVAGTGSIAVTRSTSGQMLVAGGWGWVIGDEGSAAGLVREAGRAVGRHLDLGGDPGEPLVQALFHAFAIDTTARIGSAIASCGSGANLGRHAPQIFNAAEAGSTLARQVIGEGAAALAELVARLKHVGAVSSNVVAGGAVIVAQPLLANSFIQEIERRFGGTLQAEIFRGPPVVGACRLAETLAAERPTKVLPTLCGLNPANSLT